MILKTGFKDDVVEGVVPEGPWQWLSTHRKQRLPEGSCMTLTLKATHRAEPWLGGGPASELQLGAHFLGLILFFLALLHLKFLMRVQTCLGQRALAQHLGQAPPECYSTLARALLSYFSADPEISNSSFIFPLLI